MADTDQKQRLDKWLFFSRIVKSREKAAALIKDGYVRVNGMRAEQPAKQVKPGDVLTISLERAVVVVRILLPGVRRGPAGEAQTLYETPETP